MMDLLATLYGGPIAFLNGFEPWVPLLVFGLLLAYTVALAGFIAARAGRSPLWSLALLVPWVNLAALWAFALVRWPTMNTGMDTGMDTGPVRAPEPPSGPPA